jgi:AraC family transcriptional regulator of adaptative response/methylated-DNA-[protein]-cysteine methyltransferase
VSVSLADFARIERAILYLDQNFLEQPRLADVARAAGLSEFHFQRLFRRWAGISPKRFLQFLTAGYARTLLEESRSALDAACEAGLSSVSRLHDLTVQVHAATPGEIKQGGAGLTIRYGVHKTPFGDCLLGATERGVCWLSFLPSEDGVDAMRAEWPRAAFIEDASGTRSLVKRVFGRGGDVDLHVKGTNFQVKVWEALLKIPAGTATTYEDIARQVCTTAATRAVANAVAGNRVAYLIPCHRVLRKTGGFGGYRWGVARKKAILLWESQGRNGPGVKRAKTVADAAVSQVNDGPRPVRSFGS